MNALCIGGPYDGSRVDIKHSESVKYLDWCEPVNPMVSVSNNYDILQPPKIETHVYYKLLLFGVSHFVLVHESLSQQRAIELLIENYKPIKI